MFLMSKTTVTVKNKESLDNNDGHDHVVDDGDCDDDGGGGDEWMNE
jgi:hypothetical protein